MNQDVIKDVFNKRANTLKDYDHWRYGEKLSELSDLVEIQWINNNISKTGSLLDIGCGTGRHVVELAQANSNMTFEAFDFADNNINILNQKIKQLNLNNIKTKVCDARDLLNYYFNCKFDNIVSIGLVQYLLTEEELIKHFNDCYQILNKNGCILIKHPTSFDQTFIFNGYSEFLKSNYISKYRTFDLLISCFNNCFDLEKVDRTFTNQNIGESNVAILERQNNTKQMWFLLRRK